jgi:hypothetical protein
VRFRNPTPIVKLILFQSGFINQFFSIRYEPSRLLSSPNLISETKLPINLSVPQLRSGSGVPRRQVNGTPPDKAVHDIWLYVESQPVRPSYSQLFISLIKN